MTIVCILYPRKNPWNFGGARKHIQQINNVTDWSRHTHKKKMIEEFQEEKSTPNFWNSFLFVSIDSNSLNEQHALHGTNFTFSDNIACHFIHTHTDYVTVRASGNRERILFILVRFTSCDESCSVQRLSHDVCYSVYIWLWWSRASHADNAYWHPHSKFPRT